MNRPLTTLIRLGSWLAALALILILLVAVWFLAWRGLAVMDHRLLFGDAPAWLALSGQAPVWDGLWPAVAGTLTLVLLAALLALPVGIGAGIYLAEFSRGTSRLLLSLAVELLAGIPSIVMGLFGFAIILLLRRSLAVEANTCLLLAAATIALLVLPYLVATTQTALQGIDTSLRLSGPALGLSPWQTLRYILLPAASRGILGGIALALGRAAEDTAVIMLTGVVAAAGLPSGLMEKFEALPFTIYYYTAQHTSRRELDLAFAAGLLLLLLTWCLQGGAILLQRTLGKS